MEGGQTCLARHRHDGGLPTHAGHVAGQERVLCLDDGGRGRGAVQCSAIDPGDTHPRGCAIPLPRGTCPPRSPAPPPTHPPTHPSSNAPALSCRSGAACPPVRAADSCAARFDTASMTVRTTVSL